MKKTDEERLLAAVERIAGALEKMLDVGLAPEARGGDHEMAALQRALIAPNVLPEQVQPLVLGNERLAQAVEALVAKIDTMQQETHKAFATQLEAQLRREKAATARAAQ